MHQFYQIAFQFTVFSRAPANRAALDIGVIWVCVLDFVVDAARKPEKIAFAARPADSHAIQFLARERGVVVPHVKSVRMLQRAMFALFPGLKVLQPHLEVATFSVVERAVEFPQAHRSAEVLSHQLDRLLIRSRQRRIDIEPKVWVSRHGLVERRLGWKLKLAE